MTTPTYKSYGYDIKYEPMYSMTTLDWFNVARCARLRMTENCYDIHRWRGERRTFYTALQSMNIDTWELLDV